jgi:hypothetical protein
MNVSCTTFLKGNWVIPYVPKALKKCALFDPAFHRGESIEGKECKIYPRLLISALPRTVLTEKKDLIEIYDKRRSVTCKAQHTGAQLLKML